jgi:hypothetical protein
MSNFENPNKVSKKPIQIRGVTIMLSKIFFGEKSCDDTFFQILSENSLGVFYVA